MLRDQIRESKRREKAARVARQDALALTRRDCAGARERIKTDCAAARAAIRADAHKALDVERARREEARTDYRHAVGLAAKQAPKGRRYSQRESDDLARQNIPDHLVDLFDELKHQFPYDLEPDHRAEIFLEWVEAHGDEVIAWQAERYGGDETFAASYAAYLEGAA